MRYSRQRQAVYDALVSTKLHPDAYAVYNAVKKTIPNVSLGTVYRNLAQLEAEGKINRVSAATEKCRYDGNVSPHAHFICRTCGSIIDVPFCCEQLQSQGYLVERSETVYYGICPDCRQKEVN